MLVRANLIVYVAQPRKAFLCVCHSSLLPSTQATEKLVCFNSKRRNKYIKCVLHGFTVRLLTPVILLVLANQSHSTRTNLWRGEYSHYGVSKLMSFVVSSQDVLGMCKWSLSM